MAMNMKMKQLHVFFFPFQALGNMIPIREMTKLFSSRGLKTTIITTPLNAHVFEKTLENSQLSGPKVNLRHIDFPSVEAGLPLGCECLEKLTSDEMAPNFVKATRMLQQPLEHLLDECRPNFLVADAFFPWATDSAAKFNIPRLVFHSFGFFPLCNMDPMQQYEPANSARTETFAKLISQIKDSEIRSYGAVVNTFHELEPNYANRYRNVMNVKAWGIGPVSLGNRGVEACKANKATTDDESDCLKWLESKEPNSVIYVCFGSVACSSNSQLYEIAMGLAAWGQEFILVVRNTKNDDVPQGFEEKTKGKGLVIRGWAPRTLILNHESVGGFMTHCGWNSVLEGVCAGVPMVTWPVFGEQFYIEKLVTEVLKVGVAVGSQKFNNQGVEMGAVEKAVKRIMVGKESNEFRRRAAALKDKARVAVEEGGSSYSDLDDLIENLSCYPEARLRK